MFCSFAFSSCGSPPNKRAQILKQLYFLERLPLASSLNRINGMTITSIPFAVCFSLCTVCKYAHPCNRYAINNFSYIFILNAYELTAFDNNFTSPPGSLTILMLFLVKGSDERTPLNLTTSMIYTSPISK